MRSSYERQLLHDYNRALDGTGGVLVNKAGRAAKIDGLDLFTGPLARAQRYASEELISWWKTHPRISLSQYEAMWLDSEGYGYEREEVS